MFNKTIKTKSETISIVINKLLLSFIKQMLIRINSQSINSFK